MATDVCSPAFRRKFVRRMPNFRLEAGTRNVHHSFLPYFFVPWLLIHSSLGDHAFNVRISSRAKFVILGSDIFVGLSKLFDVNLRKLDHAHLDEGVLYS